MAVRIIAGIPFYYVDIYSPIYDGFLYTAGLIRIDGANNKPISEREL